MNKENRNLKQDVRTAFECACRKQDFEIAEHLMQALETLARRDKNDDELKRLYSTVASSLHERN